MINFKIMKIFNVLCAVAFVLCISSNVANQMEAEHPTNLMDLPVEILLDIFERLDFKTLIRVGVTHPLNRNIVDMIFRNKFNNLDRKFEIFNDGLRIPNTPYELSARNNLDTVLNFLQYFGHWITKLKLDYEYYKSRTNVYRNPLEVEKSIHEHINKYVAEFINEVDLYLFYQVFYGSMKQFNKFPNAKNVTLRAGYIDATTLQAMFPAVRNLKLHEINTPHLNHFPYLEYFTTTPWNLDTISLKENLEKTLQKNPQIRHLTLYYCHWDVAKMLERVRPDLESLKISNFIYQIKSYKNGYYNVEPTPGSIQFNKMKRFKFGLRPMSPAWEKIPTEMLQQNPFVFGNLEEIEFIGKDGMQNWVRIMLENKNLKKIVANDALNGEQLDQIAEGLEKLEEFTMDCKDGDNALGRVVQFMSKAKQLKRVSLLNVHRNRCLAAAEQIPDEWKRVENSQHCSFIRK